MVYFKIIRSGLLNVDWPKFAIGFASYTQVLPKILNYSKSPIKNARDWPIQLCLCVLPEDLTMSIQRLTVTKATQREITAFELQGKVVLQKGNQLDIESLIDVLEEQLVEDVLDEELFEELMKAHIVEQDRRHT
ncbi:hypothetical protein R3P38DRAFT_2761226 [Favolaschia claudopus]|uniref:Uncharacterized protein n=1 Tax=Favolaschia claudopus TaxID=2862362 RepID=A0AAW0DTN2_9AGAR